MKTVTSLDKGVTMPRLGSSKNKMLDKMLCSVPENDTFILH